MAPTGRMFARGRRPRLALGPLIGGLLLAVAGLVLSGQPAGAGTSETFAPSEVKRVRIGGELFGYRTIGQGPPLVMVMGFSGTMAEWDPALVTPLARDHEVIVFDNRGVGESSSASVRGLSIAGMAGDTARLIRKLAPRGRADVLGWSMGAYISTQLAARHPRRVDSLVLAAGDAGGPTAVEPKRRVIKLLTDPATTPEDLLTILFPENQQAAGQAWFARLSSWPGIDEDSFDVPAATLRAQARATGAAWYGRGRGVLTRLDQISNPTLVADGLQDVVVPPANSRLLARRLPDARLRLYRDAGHAFLFQYPARFASLVNRHVG